VIGPHPDVDAYLDAASPDRRPGLLHIRAICLETLDGFIETIRYGMPSYERDGDVELGFADQKQYISFYVLRTDVMAAHRERLHGLSVGKGCIRYRRPEQIDLEVVRSIVATTARTSGRVC
jgi:uncharacterized protein YdhG (YjbR/CyaY superfamily)